MTPDDRAFSGIVGEPSEEVLAFRSWYERAGVRRTPHRVLDADDPIHGYRFFPVELIPHLGHPLVQGTQRPEVLRYLEAQHLFQWLSFTAHFEVSVVNRATLQIATGQASVESPPDVQYTAYQIYIDEGYHSLYSLDVVRQLERRTDIDAIPYDFGEYLRNLDAVGADYPGYERLVQLLQVIVFETLVTSILVDVPKDRRVIPLVRDIVRDHAIDEGTHHAYFSAFFRRVWGQFSGQERRMVAALLPDLILKSLQPAVTPTIKALDAAGFSRADRDEIVHDAYSREKVTAGIRRACANTVNLFRTMGILDDPQIADRFLAAGLIEESVVAR